MSDVNYFTCTLGQAVDINEKRPRPFSTVNDFLDVQARSIPEYPAVGFIRPSAGEDGRWGRKIVNFAELQRGSWIIAKQLSEGLLSQPQDAKESRSTVAMLFPSSPEFLFVWLGLTRLGYSSLHIAPQCQPFAVAHLCQSCGVSKLLYDDSYQDLAKAACAAATTGDGVEQSLLEAVPVAFHAGHGDILSFLEARTSQKHVQPYWDLKETDELYIHHSSGTSSGVPKPTPLSHKGAVGGLPCLSDGWQSATFTTTPLYHAGISDLFRAWTSGGMVWLFPVKDVPITAHNIVKCLEVARYANKGNSSPPVKYFSSVPFVLQMMASDEKGLALLQDMELVGVGGAALPPAVGDELVRKAVNLVSRFGNVESGFLMSSHRQYEIDLEWQYLRSNQGLGLLSFEPQGDGTFELVVLPKWPQRNKINRPDGSFATADLFVAHPRIPNAWKYHSRADSQIALITGKKFDPAPLEAAIGSSPLLEDVLVFGDQRQSAGALLFRTESEAGRTDDELIDAVWPEVDRLNRSGPKHTAIPKNLLIIIGSDEAPLEKSSKGTIMRGAAEKRFGSVIGQAYGTSREGEAQQQDGIPQREVADPDLLGAIADIVSTELGLKKGIGTNADLFSCGVDSVAAMEIRGLIQKRFLPLSSESLPLNVVYDCGTIERLAGFVLQRRRGDNVEVEDEIPLMLDLAKHYGDSIARADLVATDNKPAMDGADRAAKDVVILTGATGALGAHLLHLFREKESVSEVVCLVRGKGSIAAHERVTKSLVARNKAPLKQSDPRVRCVVSKIGDENLGLSNETYKHLASRATVIVHAAWAVNFSMRLRSFEKDHIAGISNLINFAQSSDRNVAPVFLFCSSTASVLGDPSRSLVREAVSDDPSSAAPLGYSRSKWVAESICRQAHLRSRLRGRIGVLRIGQLCGDTEGGVWNVTEAWPLMLSSVRVTRSLPDLDEPLTWLPVDVAAAAIVETAATLKTRGQDSGDLPVFHILNNDKSATWRDLLSWMRGLETPFDVVSPQKWVSQLEHLEGEAAKHPSRKLLGLWKSAYTSNAEPQRARDIEFAMTETVKAAPTMRDVKPIDGGHFRLIWRWMEEAMFSDRPRA